uniref:Uncharacterized protein n=1 Tax=Myotis myotis TaxID=51298 RepID=A0A7J7UD63_MYOMY|nr:hypothetical protein mMyoMyo1_008764 [Myotis myotis]
MERAVCVGRRGAGLGLFRVFLAQLLGRPPQLAGLPPAPPSGRVEPGCWVPEGKAEGEGERCLQDKSYLALPHRQGSHRAASPRTELLEAVFLARVIKITAEISHYLAHPKLHSISPLSWGEAKASGSDSPTLSSRELQKSSQPYCNFLFPVVNALSTCPLCCTCARGLPSAGPGLQLFLTLPPTPHPPKRSFLEMGHLPGPYCSSADRGTFSDSIETERTRDPPQPIPGMFSLLNRDCASSRPPLQLPGFQQATPPAPPHVALSCFFLP